MKTTKYFWTLCLVFAAFAFAACSDDDNGNSDELRPATSVTIDKVFLENTKSTVKDREVTFARLGQHIRIQGSGFSGLRKVLINGYETYFNNALATDNNIWVTLSGDTPVEKADPEYRNTITLIKKNGEKYVYEFTIMAAAPSITSVDNTLPQAGETVTVYGSNLQETTQVILPDGTIITDGITSDPDGEFYSFVVPAGADLSVSGSITSVGANGTAKTPEYFNENSGYIINFDDLGVLGSWSATYGSDDLVDDPLGTGRGKVALLVPQSKLDEGGLDAGSNALIWATAGNDDPDNDWARMFSFIPAETLASDVALQFDIYVPEPWEGSGQLMISLQNNLSTYGYGCADSKYSAEYKHQAAIWIPWLNEDDGTTTPFTTGERWQTITIPLSKFGNYNPDTATKTADKTAAASATFQLVSDDRNAGSWRNFEFLFVNSDIELSEDKTIKSSLFTQKIYVDNFRIVKNTAVPVSDFDDEE